MKVKTLEDHCSHQCESVCPQAEESALGLEGTGDSYKKAMALQAIEDGLLPSMSLVVVPSPYRRTC